MVYQRVPTGIEGRISGVQKAPTGSSSLCRFLDTAEITDFADKASTNTPETSIEANQAWDPAATPTLTLKAAFSADHARVNGGAVLYSFVMATALSR
jgi:hypothetical protein